MIDDIDTFDKFANHIHDVRDEFSNACSHGSQRIVDRFLENTIAFDLNMNDINIAMARACRRGHINIIEKLISHGANNWDDGLDRACRGGHRQIVDLMIANGADNWNSALNSACAGGHIDIAKLMIAHGANCWDQGLFAAVCKRKRELILLMLEKGARMSYILDDLYWPCSRGDKDITLLLIANGAHNWDLGFDGAAGSGNIELGMLMIAHGATNIKTGIDTAITREKYHFVTHFAQELHNRQLAELAALKGLSP